MPKIKPTSNGSDYCKTRRWELAKRMKKDFEERKAR